MFLMAILMTYFQSLKKTYQNKMKSLYTVKTLLKHINKYPKAYDAELLLLWVIGKEDKNPAYLYLNHNKALTKKQVDVFKRLHKRLISGIPLAYITGFCYIYNLKFYVNRYVLIPRFDTEILIDTALRHIQNIGTDLEILIADVATGSGCIVISLAHNLKKRKNLRFIGSDISHKALQIAQQNISYHRLKSKIRLIQGDMAEPVLKYISKSRKKFDRVVIISNPPYLSDKNYKKYYQNIKYEPQKALLAPDNGLYFYTKLFSQIMSELDKKIDIDIFLEHNYDQAQKIKKLAEKYLPVKMFKIFKDLGERDRVLHIKI